MAEPPSGEIERLRAIGAWMRETGALRVTLPDGLAIELSPESPPARRARTDVDDPEIAAELANVTEEERAEKSREKAHYDRWRRLTASSGAPIPAYRKRAVAPPAPPTPPEPSQ